MWSSGGLEGGPGRGRGSEPPAPPPSRHALGSPSQGARGNLEVAPQQRRRGRSDSPQAAPRTMPAWPGARGFWRPEGFQTQEAFGAVAGTLNPLSPRFLNSCQGTEALPPLTPSTPDSVHPHGHPAAVRTQPRPSGTGPPLSSVSSTGFELCPVPPFLLSLQEAPSNWNVPTPSFHLFRRFARIKDNPEEAARVPPRPWDMRQLLREGICSLVPHYHKGPFTDSRQPRLDSFCMYLGLPSESGSRSCLPSQSRLSLPTAWELPRQGTAFQRPGNPLR